MGTSVGQAIDYLVATLPSLLRAVDSAAVVADSLPDKQSQSLVVIGRSSPDSALAAEGQQVILAMGSQRREEAYEIPCWIECARSGPAQKPARDAAIALFDVFAHLIASDPSLGGVLLNGRIAQMGQVSLTQTELTDEGDVGALRVTRFDFHLTCKNHYEA